MNNDLKGLSIIFINKGDNFSLWFVLNQVKHFNPSSDVYLIGDEKNKKYNKIAQHVNIDDYFEKAEKFAKYYKHFSPNPYKFELICLQRWFALADFMERNKISRCVYLDSDVMVYSDLSKEFADFAKFGMTVNSKIFGHCMFVNNLETLKDFCNFIQKTYEEKSLADIKFQFSEYLEIVKKDKGGISDMAFINKYYKMHESEIGETGKILNDTIFDSNVNEANGFVVDKNLFTSGIKRIKMEKGIAYGTEEKTFKKVRFNVVHFQGEAKKFIPFFYSDKNIKFVIKALIAGIGFFVMTMFNFIKSFLAKFTRAFSMLGFKGMMSLVVVKLRIWILRKKRYSSNAQLFEDYFLDKFIKNKKKGFYVDIGANDPNFLNNTKYFYKKGWRGINIEPNPKLHEKFTKERPKDINLCVGIGEKTELIDFYFFNEDVSSTFSKEEAKKREDYGLKVEKVVKIEVNTLKNIFDKFLPVGVKIDFLSVDTEGFDLEAIKSNDWEKYRPKAICIETSGFRNFYVYKDKEILSFLKANNYKEVLFNGINSIFIDSKK